MQVMNMSTIKTSSDGAWQGDNPLNYAFPLLIIQTTLVLFVTRSLAFLLKPFRQPRVVAEILGGILLGPSALGRNKDFYQLVFPAWSTPILESVASIGLLFFLFLVGLELDLSSIRQSGKRAFSIALAGISLPFLFGAGVSLFLRRAVQGEENVRYGQYLLFMGVALSITAFPVLARILAELKLLTTQVGQTAMAAAAFNDMAAWILLALAVALAGNGNPNPKSPLVSIFVLISGVAFVAFMIIFIRPMMNYIAKKSSQQPDFLDEAYICLTLAGVMLSGFMTDLIGIHSIFGAFIFGLTIPKGGEFAARLIKRIEDFVSGLLLPLYFASSGLKTDVAKIRGVEAWGLLLLVISTACAGKILGTFVVAMLCMIPARESLALGVLMNTKGLVELIVLNIGKEKKVLNDEMFAILVLMALFTTFMTTPTVMAIYKTSSRLALQPHRRTGQRFALQRRDRDDEIRILVCIHGPGNITSLINLVELTRTINNSLKLYVMHLVELTDRSSSIMMVQRTRTNGVPFVNRFCRGTSNDQMSAAFEAYGHLGRVTIHHSKAISALPTMHDDICHVADDKAVSMIILPFHKKWRGEGEEVMENVGSGQRGVNQKVLDSAMCSVAILVDRGFGGSFDHVPRQPNCTTSKRVCFLFFGGADDREALKFGAKVAEHPTVRATLISFLLAGDNAISFSIMPNNHESEKELDGAAVEEFRGKCTIEYIEKAASNITEELATVGKSREFELLVVGKGVRIAKLGNHQAVYPELGPVGDILASSESGNVSSVLVIQSHSTTHADKASASIMAHDKEAAADDGVTVTDNESNV